MSKAIHPPLSPNQPPTDFEAVRVAAAAKVLNTRSDIVLKRLRARKYTIYGIDGSLQADLQHIIIAYPEHKKRLLEWKEEGYPK